EGLIVAPKGAGLLGVPGLWSDEQIAAWKENTEHLLSYSPEYDVAGAGDIPVTNGEKVRMLSREEIKEYIRFFATAASNA
ncbi:hypothetical protein MPER_00089, partial [Moniliophthora perniciosa FA553]